MTTSTAKDDTIVRVSRRGKEKRILCHYTSAAGQAGIVASQSILPSLKAVNPQDARYGDGQYFTDIQPGTMSNAQLSSRFIRNRFQGKRFSHYVCIDVAGLPLIQGRPHVFVVPNEVPLPIEGRLVSSGVN